MDKNTVVCEKCGWEIIVCPKCGNKLNTETLEAHFSSDGRYILDRRDK